MNSDGFQPGEDGFVPDHEMARNLKTQTTPSQLEYHANALRAAAELLSSAARVFSAAADMAKSDHTVENAPSVPVFLAARDMIVRADALTEATHDTLQDMVL